MMMMSVGGWETACRRFVIQPVDMKKKLATLGWFMVLVLILSIAGIADVIGLGHFFDNVEQQAIDRILNLP